MLNNFVTFSVMSSSWTASSPSPSPTKRESFGIGKEESGLTDEELQRIQELENVQLRTSPQEPETGGIQGEEGADQ